MAAKSGGVNPEWFSSSYYYHLQKYQNDGILRRFRAFLDKTLPKLKPIAHFKAAESKNAGIFLNNSGNVLTRNAFTNEIGLLAPGE
ncbi:hypothetical protein HB780_15185 [Rhizobium lusitanum]|uniref:hypothetical protein n=1 Tax=Rhizobium lusitanum TaxID=293958 RepID=UPI001611378F|nr:hypothetical protein [Rhizobium lusitanum]QND47066.1 hypothetical protein HB780_15185 [Rhizobium lusitanum]